MHLSKAIELLAKIPIMMRTAQDRDNRDAVLLGIEALKRLKFLRGLSHNEGTLHLPGETEGG